MYGLERWVDVGLDFPPVEEREVIVKGANAERFKAIVNPRAGYVYDIVTTKYQLVRHDELYGIVREIVDAMGIDPLYERVIFSGAYSATMYYRMLFEEFEMNGDVMHFGVLIRNSYVGGTSIAVLGFGVRLACTNDMVFGREIVGEYLIHTKRIAERDFSVLREAIRGVLGNLKLIGDAMEMAKNEQISAIEVANLINSFNIGKAHKLKIARMFAEKFNMDVAEIVEKKDALERMMINAYEAYNLFTQALTHRVKVNEDTRVQMLNKVTKKILAPLVAKKR